MLSVKIPALIGKSVERTKMILFRPFALKKWLSLLFIAYMAGALMTGSGGGGGSGGGNREGRAPAKPGYDGKQATSQLQAAQGSVATQKPTLAIRDRRVDDFRKNFVNLFSNPARRGFAVGTVIVIWIILLLMIVMTWLGARFRFIWFDAIVKNITAISEPFKRYQAVGNSLFQFYIVYALLILLIVAGFTITIIAIPFSAGFSFGDIRYWIPVLIATGLPLVLAFLFLLILGFVFLVVVEDFVVSIMALDGCKFAVAYRKFKEVYKANRGDIWIYFLVKFLLGFATGIAQIILGLIGLLVILIMGGIAFGLPYVIFVAMFKLKIFFITLAVILGIPFVAISFLLMMAITLPFAVFFRSFSLYFLSSLDSNYKPVALEGVISGPVTGIGT